MRSAFVCALALSALTCSSSAREPKLHRVAIQGMQFVPAVLAASPGDTIVWTNQDLVPHTVTANGRFDSGVIASNAEWRLVVKERGAVTYVCTLHPTMQARLTIR